MAQQIEWLVDWRVLWAKLSGEALIQEIIHFNVSVNQWIGEGEPPTYLIVDFTELTRFSADVRQLAQVVRAHPDNPPKWMLCVGVSNPALRFAVSVVTQLKIVNVPFRFHDSIDEAMHFLSERDPSLRDHGGVQV